MEGPRGTRLEEKESLRKCVGTVFRPTLWDEYPQLFNDDNLENCRVMVHEGEIVTHVGMLIRDASILGCRIRVANIGAVATLPEFRKRGLATQTFADCCAKAREDGCDLMIVSGDRNLYRMAGCRRVGRDVEYTITAGDILRLGDTFNPCRAPITIEPAGENDLDTMRHLYQQEPVRFIRWREDYERAMRCKFVMNRPSDFWLIKKKGRATAYIIFNHPLPTDKQTRLAEFAGDRGAVVAALPQIMAHHNLNRLTIHALGCDAELQMLMAERGIPGTIAPASGTVRVTNYVQFMGRMRPYLEETLGHSKARRLSFMEEEDDRFVLMYCDERVMIPNRGEAARLLFGAPDGSDQAILPTDHPATRALRPALPIPALWYGISYV